MKCCSCDQYFDDNTLHLVPISKKAQWERPAMGNLLAGDHGQAMAAVCSKCVKEKRTIRYAVEYKPELQGLPGINAVYHKIETLQSF